MTQNDFVRDVMRRAIDTGGIAPADYEEAESRYMQCTSDAGVMVPAVKQANGVYRYLPQEMTDAQASRWADVTTRCGEDELGPIEALYKAQIANPDGESQASAMTRCLNKYGVTGLDYKPEDFQRDWKDHFANAPYDKADANVLMCLTTLGFGL
jgi:hypothetical protein